MKTIILTLDYELYGNGSGDVFRHIINPTKKILNIVEKYGIKLTIFFEVIEYWKLKEEWEKGNRMGYVHNPVEAMEKQLKLAVSNGHDVQLHLHPQWVDAIWTDEGWKVETNQWRLGEYERTGENSLTCLLERGKNTIEQLLGPEYHCEVVRAGGYNAQPSEKLTKAMRKVGLRADSSIVPGGKEDGYLSKYDYTSIKKDLGMWYCGNNLETALDSKSDLVELPIVSFSIIRIQKYLSIDRIKSLLQNHKSAKETFEAKIQRERGGVLSKLRYFFQKEAQTWDYCLFSKSMHRKFLKAIRNQRERDVFVLIGHPKSFVSERGLVYLLEKTRKEFQYLNISKYLLKCRTL